MMSSPVKKGISIAIVLLVIGFILLNIVSYMHAYKFTHFVEHGAKTNRPETLSWPEKLKILVTGVNVPKSVNTSTPPDYGLSYTTRTLQGSDGLETKVWEVMSSVSQRTIILFHGYSSNKSALLPVATFLTHHEANVILVDLPGHGDSPYMWTTLGYREADVVKTVFDYYTSQMPHAIVLYGTSLGASSIIIGVNRYQLRPHGLILEMPYGSLYHTIQQRFQLMGMPASPFSEFLVFWGSVQCGYNAFTLNPIEFAHNISVSTLVLGGEQDHRVPPAMLQEFVNNLQGEKTLYLFNDLGHQNLFAGAQETYQEIVLTFLKDCETSFFQENK